MSALAGLTEIRLVSGGWIVGLVVDLDNENFYLEGLKYFYGARRDVEVRHGGTTAVPHHAIVSMQTHPPAGEAGAA
jgi:hypothetical protein